jgi:hypothetical protein
MKIRPAAALLLITVSAVPAVAQNRFMDQAQEAAERRAEHKAVREAENRQAAKPLATAQAAPAEAAVAPAEAPVAPAEAPVARAAHAQ